ncbi:uncharacterized protein LOC129774314 [Toxorhynchites rutilus septentrionalis]|uniref:uncharacterized protein LOC129774314 n=1 Tax=Toxorhynchites rutilus septentrionalis TaxID=329112 RepID=UPI002478EB86|nr:uncharacterized protein LOC129774314 [Toxorhynchites rutilus septentrionalis]
MAESGGPSDMEVSDSSSLLTDKKKSLKRVPNTEDTSSGDESANPTKPPSKKLANLPSALNDPTLPSTSSSPSVLPAPSQPSPSHSQSPSSPSPSVIPTPRVKVYPEDAPGTGPWVVFFRPKPNGKALRVMQIAKDLARYTSVSEISKVRPNKLRVVVNDRKDANKIVVDQHFTIEYRIYIPSHIVEIEGVITETGLTCEYITSEGTGRFKKLPSTTVKILGCRQLGTVSHEGEEKKFTPSNSFRVTFAGSALPDYVMVDKLRLAVRLFIPKSMTCLFLLSERPTILMPREIKTDGSPKDLD